MCRSTKVSISKSSGGRLGLKSLKNEHFHFSKSLGICNCQTWVFHDCMETGNLLAENLVATALKIEIGYIGQFASISVAPFKKKKKKKSISITNYLSCIFFLESSVLYLYGLKVKMQDRCFKFFYVEFEITIIW